MVPGFAGGDSWAGQKSVGRDVRGCLDDGYKLISLDVTNKSTIDYSGFINHLYSMDNGLAGHCRRAGRVPAGLCGLVSTPGHPGRMRPPCAPRGGWLSASRKPAA